MAADELADFAAGYPFGLDPFQRAACETLAAGDSVLVCAPTGAGKTVVGEFAVHLALAQGQKCFYTTPIKALSNQKHADLSARYGAHRVGLLTGDTSIYGEAPIVVMTTEVLRNMLYAGSSSLTGLGFVVMDEVHYLADRFRGAVWEEVIIHLPASVRLVSLSATVSNAEEFADWLVTVRGHTRAVLEEHRPVPLFQHVMAGNRLFDLMSEDGLTVNPQLLEIAREDVKVERWREHRDRGRGGYGQRPRSRARPPDRVDAVLRLDSEGLLPAIVFVFSRAGCDQSVERCVAAGVRLLPDGQRPLVREIAERHTAPLSDDDLRVLGYASWLDALERGVAAHHAGLLPAFKEAVEELFVRGLVRVVFATETLALGINMPARSVVLTSLSKWDGETHADVTPGEYTQLTGRAGRRGIDIEGHAVVLWQSGLDPRQVAGLASTRTYPLRSSFRPSYNMAVNLVGAIGRDRARELLSSSFAQFQADRSVVGIARQVARNEEALQGYDEAATCEHGDVAAYDRLRRAIKEREAMLAREGSRQRRGAARDVLDALRIGDVIRVPGGRRAGVAVVLDPGKPPARATPARGHVEDEPRPVVLTTDRQVRRLSIVDFPSPPDVLGRVRIPKSFNARSPQSRRDLASTLHHQGYSERTLRPGGRSGRGRSPAADDDELLRLRVALRAHPVHGCADREQHLRWAERRERLERETAALRRQVEDRTHSLARTFDRVCTVLTDLGYLSGAGVTEAGTRLARIYAESDLVVAECLRRGLWDGLDAASLAAVVSTIVYEPRRPDEVPARVAPPAVMAVVADTARVAADLAEREAHHRLDALRTPDPGLCWAVHAWASGAALGTVLSGADLTAGDFVRWVRQLVDLLDQLSDDPSAGASARSAVRALRRGVVAA